MKEKKDNVFKRISEKVKAIWKRLGEPDYDVREPSVVLEEAKEKLAETRAKYDDSGLLKRIRYKKTIAKLEEVKKDETYNKELAEKIEENKERE